MKTRRLNVASCIAILLCGLMFASPLIAQKDYQPTAENLKNRQWFQDAKFGMFIHWGVFSVPGDGEWVMNEKKIPIVEYEKLAPQFNPTKFNAVEWVALAKASGMKYITLITKHHDGFAMWDSKVSDWTIVKRTPYGKDVVKQLADECHKQGIKLFLYHSQLDWHNPDYYPRGMTGKTAGRPESGDFNRYLDYMDAQLTELLTNYGEIGGIWFDGMWDKPEAPWRLDQTYSLIHKLQPGALVGSNHHKKPFPGEDFQMFEKDLPGSKTTGFNPDQEVSALPKETCETISGAWGYNANDKNYKSTRDLIHYLVRSAGYDANFLLNVGPKPDGTIQPEFQTRLREMGAWLAKNGDSIYGTRGGPISPRPWGVTTKKGNRVYVHVLDWQDEVLALPTVPGLKSAHLLGGDKVAFENAKGATLLHLDSAKLDAVDTIVVLELEAKK